MVEFILDILSMVLGPLGDVVFGVSAFLRANRERA